MAKVQIADLNKASVLAALYNGARAQGMGFIQYNPEPMTDEQAQDLIDRKIFSFDYLKGRVMKIDISGDEVETSGYDRDNGAGIAEKIIELLRAGADTNSTDIQNIHLNGIDDAMEIELNRIRKPMTEADFVALGRAKERIEMTDDIQGMLLKLCEGHALALKVLTRLLNESKNGFMQILGLDTNRLYGARIWDLYKLCGKDLERFEYHLDMELPNQGTGHVSITGPYCSKVDQDAHFAARKFGKPGSFWALENPPTDPNYEYPIIVK